MFLLFCFLFPTITLTAYARQIKPDSVLVLGDTTFSQKDLIDLYLSATKNHTKRHPVKPETKTKLVHYALFPAAGYTLQTGFAVVAAANAVFYTDAYDSAKASNIMGTIAFTQYSQIILPICANIWTKNETYNIISDLRYMNYPSQTFGLGAKSKP